MHTKVKIYAKRNVYISVTKDTFHIVYHAYEYGPYGAWFCDELYIVSRRMVRICLGNVRVYLTLLEPHSHIWGQFTLNISSLSPKRDWGPKRVKVDIVRHH